MPESMKAFIKKVLLGLSLSGIILSAYLILSDKPINKSPYTISQRTKSTNKIETDESKMQSIDEESEKDKGYLLGSIAIPSINRTLQIYDYQDEQEPYITNGAMMDLPNRTMGVDNVVLASHDYNETFGELIHVSIGDMLYTTNDSLLYSFEVVEVFQATDNNVQDIKKVREEKRQPTLTLYTCFGEAGTTQRIVVQGTIKEVMPIDTANEKIRELFTP